MRWPKFGGSCAAVLLASGVAAQDIKAGRVEALFERWNRSDSPGCAVAVLRDGQVVGTVKTTETTPRELAYMMVGREVVLDIQKRAFQPAEVMLEAQHLHVLGDRGLPALNDVSFQVQAGEILGIAGVDGNGQLELEEVICGLRDLMGGEIHISGQCVNHYSPSRRHDLGLAHIPSDRLDRGLATGLSVADNLVASRISRKPFSRLGQLNLPAIQDFVRRAIAEFKIRTASPAAPASTLSGGNQQRIILASALEHNPQVIIAAQPTRGLDVGLMQQVYRRLLTEREKGKAILLISTELDEILALSDRIAVMYRGEIMGILPTAKADINTIGLMMAGHRLSSVETEAA